MFARGKQSQEAVHEFVIKLDKNRKPEDRIGRWSDEIGDRYIFVSSSEWSRDLWSRLVYWTLGNGI